MKKLLLFVLFMIFSSQLILADFPEIYSTSSCQNEYGDAWGDDPFGGGSICKISPQGFDVWDDSLGEGVCDKNSVNADNPVFYVSFSYGYGIRRGNYYDFLDLNKADEKCFTSLDLGKTPEECYTEWGMEYCSSVCYADFSGRGFYSTKDNKCITSGQYSYKYDSSEGEAIASIAGFGINGYRCVEDVTKRFDNTDFYEGYTQENVCNDVREGYDEAAEPRFEDDELIAKCSRPSSGWATYLHNNGEVNEYESTWCASDSGIILNIRFDSHFGTYPGYANVYFSSNSVGKDEKYEYEYEDFYGTQWRDEKYVEDISARDPSLDCLNLELDYPEPDLAEEEYLGNYKWDGSGGITNGFFVWSSLDRNKAGCYQVVSKGELRGEEFLVQGCPIDGNPCWKVDGLKREISGDVCDEGLCGAPPADPPFECPEEKPRTEVCAPDADEFTGGCGDDQYLCCPEIDGKEAMICPYEYPNCHGGGICGVNSPFDIPQDQRGCCCYFCDDVTEDCDKFCGDGDGQCDVNEFVNCSCDKDCIGVPEYVEKCYPEGFCGDGQCDVNESRDCSCDKDCIENLEYVEKCNSPNGVCEPDKGENCGNSEDCVCDEDKDEVCNINECVVPFVNWTDEEGNEISNASVGDTVRLVYEKSGLEPETEVDFEVFERDLVSADDEIRTIDSGNVLNGVIDEFGDSFVEMIITEGDFLEGDETLEGEEQEFYFIINELESDELEVSEKSGAEVVNFEGDVYWTYKNKKINVTVAGTSVVGIIEGLDEGDDVDYKIENEDGVVYVSGSNNSNDEGIIEIGWDAGEKQEEEGEYNLGRYVIVFRIGEGGEINSGSEKYNFGELNAYLTREDIPPEELSYSSESFLHSSEAIVRLPGFSWINFMIVLILISIFYYFYHSKWKS